MHSALFHHAADVNPMAHGFFDMSRNGQWVIGHSGNLIFFHSLLMLMPEHKIGLFISYNTGGGQRAAKETFDLFMNRYYPPGKTPSVTRVKNPKNQLQRFDGYYFSSRRVHRRFTKLGALVQAVKVAHSEDGVLKTIGKETTRWIETKLLTFREENGLGTLVFREDDSGRITHMFMGDRPYMALERVGYTDSIILHVVLATTAMLLFFATALAWPFAALIRWRHDVKLNPQASIPGLAYLIAWSASFLFIVVTAFLAVGLGDPNVIVFGIPLWIKMIMLLAIVSALLTAGAFLYGVLIWKSGKGSIWGRVYYTAVVLALICTLWQLNHWKLLGFNF
jgi:hypothetical protein